MGKLAGNLQNSDPSDPRELNSEGNLTSRDENHSYFVCLMSMNKKRWLDTDAYSPVDTPVSHSTNKELAQ